MFKGLKSLIAGIAAGTALGMFFAPKKGEETRKNIKDEVDSGGSGLQTIKKTLLSMGQDIGDACKEAYDEISDNESVQTAKKKAEKAVKTATKKAKSAYKKNVPAKTRRKINKTVKDAEKKAKSAIDKAKKTIKKKK